MQPLVPSPSIDIFAESTTNGPGVGGEIKTISHRHVAQSSRFRTGTGHNGLPVLSETRNSQTDLYSPQTEGGGWNHTYDTRSPFTSEGSQSAEAYDTSLNWQMNLQRTEANAQTGCIPVSLYETTHTPSGHGQSPLSSGSHCWLPRLPFDRSSNNLVDGSLQPYYHEPSDDRHHSMGVSPEAPYEPTAYQPPPEAKPILDSLLSTSSSMTVEPLWAPDLPIKLQDRNGVSIPGALWQASLKCYWRGCYTILPRSSFSTYVNFLKKVFEHLAEHVGESDRPFRCRWLGCEHRPKETTKPVPKRDRIQHVLTHIAHWYHLCTNCGKLYSRKYTGEQKHSCRKNPNIPEHCSEMTLASFWDCYGYPVENIV